MKTFTGLSTRYFAMKKNLVKLQEDYFDVAFGTLCKKPENMANANSLHRQIKRLKISMKLELAK